MLDKLKSNSKLTDDQKAELAISLVERSAPIIPEFAKDLRQSYGRAEGKTIAQSKIERALDLLDALSDFFDVAPDANYIRDIYLITGDHMVLTDEGWVTSESNTWEVTGEEPMEVFDEVNKP